MNKLLQYTLNLSTISINFGTLNTKRSYTLGYFLILTQAFPYQHAQNIITKKCQQTPAIELSDAC
jgi:hypothetical protein